MKKIFFSALAALSLVACVQEAVVDTPQGDAIAFENAFVDNATRATSLTADNLNAFRVWGFINNTNSVIFDGTDVTGSGNSWSYTGTQYWIPNQDYYFAALAPVVDGSVKNAVIEPAEGESAKLGLGTVTFTNDGSTDLIYAQAYKESKQSGNPAVAFTFKHLLSKVKFTFTTAINVENITAEVSDIKITVPESGMINLASETPEWTIHQNKVTLEYDSTVEEPDLFTIPTAAYDYEIKFTVTLRQGGDDILTIEKASTVNALALEMGKAYNFAAEINPQTLGFEDIVFDVDGVDGWETGSTVDMPVGVKTATELVAAVEAGKDVVLLEDIDLDALAELITVRSNTITSNWTPVGTSEKPYTGVFDGNGKTIKNLKLVESEAKEGKAYIGFFGYAKDATIKNVTFENVYINIPCLDIDHSQGHIGAVAGSLEGTCLIEDVTVKGDIQVYATQDANGASRVAVVAGGNAYGDVTMKNVHVIAKEGSYLKANNNTGALAGQLQGKMYFENCSSNINVTVNKFFAGGLVGIAAGDSKFVNCRTTGNVAVVAGREGRHNDEYRVGGIAGGWADGKTKVCTLENCSYTGTVSGKNTDGTTAEPLDYMGYVGRGYTLSNCAGSKVVIDGKEFIQKYDNVYGEYIVNTPVSTADQLIEALEANEGVIFKNDIKIEPASMSNSYGKTGINVKNGQTINGNGFKLDIKGAGGTWDSGICTSGGLIKDLWVTGSFRGIFVKGGDHVEKVVLNNVRVEGTTYTISIDSASNQGLEATNCIFRGWTSYAATIGNVKFDGCTFGAGSGYNFSRPYAPTEYVNCTFEAGHKMDPRAEVTFENCTLNGEALTSENLMNLVTANWHNAGLPVVTTTEGLQAKLVNGEDVILANDLTIGTNEATTAPYGNKTGLSHKGGVFNGNGKTLTFDIPGDNYGIMTAGGTIKDLTATGVFRGIVIMSANKTINLENVVSGGKGVVYALNTTEGDSTQDLVATNCTFNGWCSWSLLKSATFTNCTFGQGSEYSNVIGRLGKPYVNTVYDGCNFCSKYYIDLSALGADQTITIKDCTVDGVKITAENWTSLVAPEDTCGEGQISVELKNGTFLTAENVADYIVFE